MGGKENIYFNFGSDLIIIRLLVLFAVAKAWQHSNTFILKVPSNVYRSKKQSRI
jgi:hypothetical protein